MIATYDGWLPLAIWVASAIFLVMAALMTNMRRHPLGRALITTFFGLLLTTTPGLLHKLFGISLVNEGFAWYYAVSLTTVLAGIVQKIIILAVVQRGPDHDIMPPQATPEED